MSRFQTNSRLDEVVANGDGSWKWPLTRKFAWYNQEWARGAYLVSLSPLAGWKFSEYYSKTDVVGHLQGEEVYGPRRYTPAETFEISDESLKAHPFFRGFRDAELYGEGGSAFLQANPYVLWYALSHGIPAESFAAVAPCVKKIDGKIHMFHQARRQPDAKAGDWACANKDDLIWHATSDDGIHFVSDGQEHAFAPSNKWSRRTATTHWRSFGSFRLAAFRLVVSSMRCIQFRTQPKSMRVLAQAEPSR